MDSDPTDEMIDAGVNALEIHAGSPSMVVVEAVYAAMRKAQWDALCALPLPPEWFRKGVN